jgi:ATP synthase F1 delta subunit
MTPSMELLATKYAKAFVHVFGEKLTDEQLKALQELVALYDKNRQQFFYLYLSSISSAVKQHILLDLVARFHLRELLQPLIILLGEQGRLPLLFPIAHQIEVVFNEEHDLVEVQFMTAHELSAHNVAVMQQFLERLTGKKIQPTVIVKPELIAGVRLQSETFVWEYSIAQQLRALHLR